VSARFAKLDDGSWGVKLAPDNQASGTGDSVRIVTRAGRESVATLGDLVGTNQYGDRIFKIAQEDKPEVDDSLTPITEIGAFEFGGECFIVKRTKDGERLYAMKVVEHTADRINEADGVVQIELEYQRGAMAFLREEHRLDEARAKELSIRYGKCIVCGRKLKAAKSVEAGIGPVCMGRVRSRAA